MTADTTSGAFRPMQKKNLADRLAERIRLMIQEGSHREGDRLPSIMDMAKRFGVGHPTLREALKKLEAMGVVEIRHGSGVYVTRARDVLFVATPDLGGAVTKKLLIDLIQTRALLEIPSIAAACQHITADQLAELRRLLTVASANLANEAQLNAANLAFHRQIALASGNTVVAQMLEVIGNVFSEELRTVLGIDSRERRLEEHSSILEALEKRDEELCRQRMSAHLDALEAAIRRWDPERQPVGR